jgi:16S rRNA (adenine1518-N6/adenine1519-N6)-dimethyltransferase
MAAENRSEHRARKRFGQHFLVDRGIIQQIVALVQPQAGEVVLEVGPGLGALTTRLVEKLPRLVGVEIDRDLAAVLREKISAQNFRLVEADILRVDWADILREEDAEKLFIIGNLPYNITAPFLFKALAEADRVSTAILMLQREVARRLVARPGNKEYGQITVLLAMRAEIELRIDVGRRAFRPVPGVDSSVIEVRFAAAPRFAVRDERHFTTVVRTAFGQRRKMLRNTLRGMASVDGRDWLPEIAAESGVEMTRRPEELSVEEFVCLSDAFSVIREQQP